MCYLLNHEEIKQEKIMRYTQEYRFGVASYDLAVGSIFQINGNNNVRKYELPPQGMVLVVSEEEFQLPRDIIGFTTIRNSLSVKGILAINIGLVDPGYNGPISTILMNFGRRNFEIKKGDPVLRMTFQKFKKPQEIPRKGEKYERFGYERNRKNTVRASLESTFLNLELTGKKIRNEILNEFVKYSVIIAALIAALNFGLQFLNELFK